MATVRCSKSAMSVIRLVSVPVLGLLVLAAAGAPNAPAPASAARAPAGPPDGTYIYALSRNGGNVGTTTVVIHRRDDVRELETDEAGSAAAARVHILGSYRYSDLGVQSYSGTYQAPFLRSSPLGRLYKFRAAPDYHAQTTVRYRAGAASLTASIDGTPFADLLGVPADVKRAVRIPWLFDAPFMTGTLLLPAFRHRSNEASLAPVSEAFPSGVATVAQRLVRAAAAFPGTPKSDLAVDVPGLVRVWFDPATYIVHEAHFTAVNFDARLLSYIKGGYTAPFAPELPGAPAPPLAREISTVTAADGTSLGALVSRPPGGKAPSPVVVLVPPGPGAGADYDGEGPTPMYPDLARALVQRGYAVLRYDMRGIGKSGGSAQAETWDQALADARAALDRVTQDPALDAKRTYALGYGNGADLALAAAASGNVSLAGVIALAPTVLSYRNCPAAIDAGALAASDVTWRKSSLAHDPGALAARAKAPLLVLHPGLPVCNETKDQIDAYDDRLRAANPLATVIAATDLTQRFGSRYEAEAPLDTQEFFPYRFDASTAVAIGDWLDHPKSASASGVTHGTPGGAPVKPPPPPPGVDANGSGLPNPRAGGSARPEPARSVEPGVVLPSGTTPPPFVAQPPTDTPVPTPRPPATAAPAVASASPAAPPASPAATVTP